MNRIIEIIVGPTGRTQIQTKGFAGRGCLDASRFLESTLGKPVVDKLTDEFHAASANLVATQRQGLYPPNNQQGIH